MKGREDTSSSTSRVGDAARPPGCQVAGRGGGTGRVMHMHALVFACLHAHISMRVFPQVSVYVPASLFLCILPCVLACVCPHTHPMHVAPMHAMQKHMEEPILILEARAHQGMGAAGRALAVPPLETSGLVCLPMLLLPGLGVALWLIVMGSVAMR